jgi:hypothetical protein
MNEDDTLFSQILGVLHEPPAPDDQPDFADELWLEVRDTLRNRSDTPTAPNLIVVGIDDAPGRRTALAGRTAIWVATAAVAAAIAAVAWFGNIGSNTIDGTASETLACAGGRGDEVVGVAFVVLYL